MDDLVGSKRLDLYEAHAERLVAEGKAFACYCTREELDAGRKVAEAEKRQFRYPGTCRERPFDLSRPHVIRFRVPEQGAPSWDDLVKGLIATPHDTPQDEVILRSDRVPLYNFGAVVDDITMKVNLVGRGDDHVNNTARQILMYQALGYPVPTFAHFPMILGADKTRLSKRHGATSVTQYREMGYLPEAVMNYLVRLGWSHGDQEIFTTFNTVLSMGESSVGEWKLTVIDYATQDAGELRSWKLNLIGKPVASDNTYFYTDEFAGAAQAQAARATLADDVGFDTLNAAAVTSASTLDLNPGATSSLAGASLTIDVATMIEAAIGGDGNDRITGNVADNLLRGMRGNDTLFGESGTDTLLGGAGDDVLWGGRGHDALDGGD